MNGHKYVVVSPGGMRGQVYEHTLVAEAALNKPLPKGAMVHHVNGNRKDNRNSNLVICQDNSYHKLLHCRARIVKRGGNPNTEKICGQCDRVKPKSEFYRMTKAWDGVTNTCQICARIAGAVRYEHLVKSGHCISCKEPVDVVGEVHCAEHKEKNHQRWREKKSQAAIGGELR